MWSAQNAGFEQIWAKMASGPSSEHQGLQFCRTKALQARKHCKTRGLATPGWAGQHGKPLLKRQGLGSYTLYLEMSLPLLHALQGPRAPALLMRTGWSESFGRCRQSSP